MISSEEYLIIVLVCVLTLIVTTGAFMADMSTIKPDTEVEAIEETEPTEIKETIPEITEPATTEATETTEPTYTEPVTEPATEEPTYTEPVTEPPVKETEPPVVEETEPVTEPVTEPETEPTTEPTEPPVEEEEQTEESYDPVELLACVIYQEAGSDSICDDCRYRVADVVLNRVADPRYPDTIHGVLTQSGQYGNYSKTGVVWPKRANNSGEKHAVQRAYAIAMSVVAGTHSELYGEGYIYQAQFIQGKDNIYCCNHYYGR